MPNAKKKGYSAKDLREVSDNPEWTRKDFAKARPFSEALPDLAASIRKGRGPNKAPTKKLVSLRLSGQVLEAYKAKGPGWQSRIDEDLRRYRSRKPAIGGLIGLSAAGEGIAARLDRNSLVLPVIQ
jgi:uncharacterized protein (DUF4415 family)